MRMYSGFETKKEAEDARKITIRELANGSYVVNDNVKVRDFLDYWLEYDIRKRVQSSNTYESYSSIVRNHINPAIGSKKLTEVNKGDVQRLYKNRAEYSKSIVRQVKTVMNVSFHYAVSHKLISMSPTEGIDLPKTVKAKSYHTRNIDTAKTLNMNQILLLLEESKDTPIHMQVLFNVLMGLRRQEINAVKYTDVDYINRTLTVERQLGKELDRTPNSKREKMTKKELPLKTPVKGCFLYQTMYLRPFWKRERNMNSTKAADVLFFRIMVIFVAPATAEDQDRKTFIGNITRNC
jgi:integrase